MVENVLLECVGKSIGQKGGVSLDDRLVDLEIDSLRFVQLVVQLEHALGIEFADENLNYRRFEQIRDVLQYLNELISGSGQGGILESPRASLDGAQRRNIARLIARKSKINQQHVSRDTPLTTFRLKEAHKHLIIRGAVAMIAGG